jgi:hypothetical protein
MEFREPIEPDMQTRQGLPGEGANAANLASLRAQGGDLLAAADQAIRTALSGNAQGFLNSVRQTGGE